MFHKNLFGRTDLRTVIEWQLQFSCLYRSTVSVDRKCNLQAKGKNEKITGSERISRPALQFVVRPFCSVCSFLIWYSHLILCWIERSKSHLLVGKSIHTYSVHASIQSVESERERGREWMNCIIKDGMKANSSRNIVRLFSKNLQLSSFFLLISSPTQRQGCYKSIKCISRCTKSMQLLQPWPLVA